MEPLPARIPPVPASASPVPVHPFLSAAPVALHPRPAVPRVKSTKAHVPSACINCKKAHLACDLSRPCKRCVSVGKDDTCRDVEHKKRGRPKLVDKAIALERANKEAAATGSAPSLPSAVVSASTGLAKMRPKAKYTKAAYKITKKTIPSPAESCSATTPHMSAPTRDPTAVVTTATTANQDPSPAYDSRVDPHSSTHDRDQARPANSHDGYYFTPAHPPPSHAKRPQELYVSPGNHPLATIFLTMNLVCARVSDESQALWGYHPHDISHKSLYTIVDPIDHAKVRSLIAMIREALFSATAPTTSASQLAHFPFIESTSPVFYQNRPGIMSSSAPGASEYADVIRILSADGSSDLFNIRMYIGGGLGADVIRGLGAEHAYLVCLMTRYMPSSPADHSRPSERSVHQESRIQTFGGSSAVVGSDSRYLSSKQSMSSHGYAPEPTSSMDATRKISLPPIMTDPTTSSTSTTSLPSPSVPSPVGRFAPSSGSYSVPLAKPAQQASTLPSFRTGPLHTARWLYDSEPNSTHSSSSTTSHRLPAVFPDPFRSMSAPMGGFGVSKYLSRSEPSNAFPPTKRHQLPLPSPSSLHQSSASSNSFGLARSDSNSALSDAYSSRMPAPRSLQRDLSSSSLGASFESRSPPASSSMKRPLADMADSQDRNRDIDSRHQSHHDLPAPHQSPRVPFSTTASISSPSTMSTTSTSSLGQHSRPLPTGASKLDIKSMPPDHPTIDPASSGVCPIVHGSMQRERAQQQVQSEPKAGSYRNSMEHERHRGADQAPCRWANMSDRWNEPSGQGNFGQDYYGPSSGYRREHEREHEREPLARKSLEHGGESMQSNGAYYPPSNSGPHSRVHAYERDYAGSNGGYFGPQGESHRANGYSSHPRDHHHEADSGMAKNPFNMGPSPPGTTGSLRRTNSTGRPGFLSRNRSSNGSMNDGMCLSGACGAVCRCSGEDEEIRAVKALDAARKRMSVHSLLC